MHFTPYMAWAAATFAILTIGRWLATRNHSLHPKLMIIGVLSDLTLVLVLQYQRHAIQSVAGNKIHSWQLAHVITATLALLLYFPAIAYGAKIHKTLADTKSRVRRIHIRLGNSAYFLRAISFLLMFSMSSNR